MEHIAMPTFALVASALALAIAFAAPAEAQGVEGLVVVRAASRSTLPAPAEHFTGTARVERLFDATAATLASGASVSFEAGARTAWHTHPRGQVLVVTAGVGRVQRWGAPAEEIRPGDVVRIPPGVKHWHGAAPATAMTHVAVQEHEGGQVVEWLEPVSDDEYGTPVPALDAAAPSPDAAGTEPSRAQQLMGDIAPRLAALTDDVLFGQVWAGPELSQRDRSLVTVSALVAMNRPDQLRSHLARGLQNGLTREEIVGAITHLAFYAGWPNAVTAVGVAREVLDEAGR